MSEHPTAGTRRIDPELRSHLARAFGMEPAPERYDALWRRLVETYETGLGRDLTPEDLCTTDESPHRATVDGETYRFQCVTDAFVLGLAVEGPVAARTVTPVDGAELVVEFEDGEPAAVPEGTVLSFGVERAVEAPDGTLTPGETYGRVCPYSKAFASREAYETWDAANPEVVSDAQPLGSALDQLSGLSTAGLGGVPGGNRASAGNDATASCSCCSQ